MTPWAHPEHLPQVRVSEAEGDVGDVEAFGLGLTGALVVTPTPRSAARRYGHGQRLGVRGHGDRHLLLVKWRVRVCVCVCGGENERERKGAGADRGEDREDVGVDGEIQGE